ncbi:hypothetical protein CAUPRSCDRAFT_12741 [Caulochytrium protostelioides]|uniref:Uncharacterized protein n=1 Tax=Caulochytrium protostelioides TaxID=1555241 RepID=A0A4P9WTL9_9FUNG|nr:hypothetical protein CAUPRSCDRAFT_12741 [Caulochytrium protostelioides]
MARQQARGRPLWRVSSTLFFHTASDQLLEPLGPFKTRYEARRKLIEAANAEDPSVPPQPASQVPVTFPPLLAGHQRGSAAGWGSVASIVAAGAAGAAAASSFTAAGAAGAAAASSFTAAGAGAPVTIGAAAVSRASLLTGINASRTMAALAFASASRCAFWAARRSAACCAWRATAASFACM